MLHHPFLPFDWEIWKRIWKTVLKNSSLTNACIINKKNTTVHENSFANPFSDSQLNGKKEIHEIPIWIFNWNPPWGRISQRWNPFSDFVFDCKILNLNFKINIWISQLNATLVACIWIVAIRILNILRATSNWANCIPQLVEEPLNSSGISL